MSKTIRWIVRAKVANSATCSACAPHAEQVDLGRNRANEQKHEDQPQFAVAADKAADALEQIGHGNGDNRDRQYGEMAISDCAHQAIDGHEHAESVENGQQHPHRRLGRALLFRRVFGCVGFADGFKAGTWSGAQETAEGFAAHHVSRSAEVGGEDECAAGNRCRKECGVHANRLCGGTEWQAQGAPAYQGNARQTSPRGLPSVFCAKAGATRQAMAVPARRLAEPNPSTSIFCSLLPQLDTVNGPFAARVATRQPIKANRNQTSQSRSF